MSYAYLPSKYRNKISNHIIIHYLSTVKVFWGYYGGHIFIYYLALDAQYVPGLSGHPLQYRQPHNYL